MKAVLQFRAGPAFRARIAADAPADIEVVIVAEDDEAAFAREMTDAEALLHVLKPVTADVIAAAPALKLIQKIGVGVNTIDLDAAREHGVAVANMPGTNSQAVAEMTLALMLTTLRRVPLLDSAMRDGQGWTLDPATFDAMGEIAGRTVGLVGYGEISQRLAPVLKAMGASVLYVARTDRPEAVATRCSLDMLLAESDIVSLHLPLTGETANMIDAAAIARMKPGAVLVNTARGGLVDEDALVAALETGHIAAAGLDTVSDEPAPATNPLFALENVVVTPHIAWLTPETLDRSLAIAFENCRRVVAGEPLLNQIDLAGL
ncbi:MAG: 2-hydroxyacid dehydrogenase [Alphaproteobacteria bacterium]